MKSLVETMQKHSQVDRSLRYRERRGHYASSALSCPRDLYWALTGVKRTNHTDFLGKMKMLVGSAVEAQLVKEYFSDLHWYGIHMLGTQAQVGESSPNVWDGNIDVVLAQRVGENFSKPYVVEVKTKSGYGADLLYSSGIPSEEYMAQLGLYLRHLNSKGVTNQGCLFYVLLSDKAFGKVLQVDCHYDQATNSVVATRAIYSDTWLSKDLDYRLCLDQVDQNFSYVESCLAKKEVPKASFVYKYPLTKDLLSKQSDDTIRKMLRGEKILGDWQARYSGYLDHNLAYDKVSRTYDSEELKLIEAEQLKRHPRSKLRASQGE